MHFVDYRQQTLHAFNDQNMTYYFDHQLIPSLAMYDIIKTKII
jgi:hypothetical protein